MITQEQQVFKELEEICQSPGYIHALAALYFKDNAIPYNEELKPEDLNKLYDKNRLIRTEFMTLVGLMIKADLDWNIPKESETLEHCEKTNKKLEELHSSLSEPTIAKIAEASSNENPFRDASALREPIFYAGESAYNFQYLDLAPKRYSKDRKWLLDNLGFDIEQAALVANAIEDVVNTRMDTILRDIYIGEITPTFLHCYTFCTSDITESSGLNLNIVKKIIDQFCIPSAASNEDFNELGAFNLANARPLIKKNDQEYIIFNSYALAESIYESPYHWMQNDKSYKNEVAKHRGEFTEEYIYERLSNTFGKSYVYRGVDVYTNKSKRNCEVDVLVIWGNKAICVQCKSKQLTIEARKGNDGALQNDFKRSIQDAYDQNWLCKLAIENPENYKFNSQNNTVNIPSFIDEVYMLCVVSSHYPALSFQSRHLLTKKSDDVLSSPLITDIFTIDIIAEMLSTPLQFINYVKKRINYNDRLLAENELTILGYHLKQNLWFSDEHNLIAIDNDYSQELDLAMIVRRLGEKGQHTPSGILTKFNHTCIWRILLDIEQHPSPATIELGLLLLSLSEEAIINMSAAIENIAARTRNDNQIHDVAFPIDNDTGITFHSTIATDKQAYKTLERMCRLRKYRHKADKWFGVCLDPFGPVTRFGITFFDRWEYSEELETLTEYMQEGVPTNTALDQLNEKRIGKGKEKIKIGRNEKCPCGSGIKYKKCCL